MLVIGSGGIPMIVCYVVCSCSYRKILSKDIDKIKGEET